MSIYRRLLKLIQQKTWSFVGACKVQWSEAIVTMFAL